jgi:hypothetical protein
VLAESFIKPEHSQAGRAKIIEMLLALSGM